MIFMREDKMTSSNYMKYELEVSFLKDPSFNWHFINKQEAVEKTKMGGGSRGSEGLPQIGNPRTIEI